MPEQSPQSSATAPGKPWYMKWWVWLIAAVVVVGGIGALVNPDGTAPTGAAEPSQDAPTEPSETPTQLPPLDVEAFLTNAGATFDKAAIMAGKAYIYVPTDTTNDQAQQIAEDAMLYLCDHAKQSGRNSPVASRVEVSDGVSPVTEGYHAEEHPSGFATDDICQD